MRTDRMPLSENCLVWAECRTWLGGMPTGRNTDYSHCYSHISDRLTHIFYLILSNSYVNHWSFTVSGFID